MRSDSARDAVPVRAMPRQKIGGECVVVFRADEFDSGLVDSATFSVSRVVGPPWLRLWALLLLFSLPRPFPFLKLDNEKSLVANGENLVKKLSNV
jgi:hypothetical protein